MPVTVVSKSSVAMIEAAHRRALEKRRLKLLEASWPDFAVPTEIVRKAADGFEIVNTMLVLRRNGASERETDAL